MAIRIRMGERKNAQAEKRYRTRDVAQAIGRSEGSISAYFSNRNVSTKGGITISQIAEVIRARTRGDGINWNEVKDIRSRLSKEHAIFIEDTDAEDSQQKLF